MNLILKEKINEAISSVLPITVIVLILSIFVVQMPIGTTVLFLTGAVLLVVGMGFFSLGVDISMTPMGEGMGTYLIKSKKVGIIVFLGFVLGVMITIAEPDLQVLADQVPAIPNMTLILTVAVGVGVLFVIAAFRTFLRIPLSVMLVVFYIIVFALAAFTPKSFVPVAFDSGGVTTGPISVPFIMALGVGMTAMRGDKRAKNDSFGFVALCSIGPIAAVLILGILYKPSSASYEEIVVPIVFTTRDVVKEFVEAFPEYFKEVFIALFPMIVCLVLFQVITKRFHKYELIKISMGLLYTYIGLVLFLTGVNVGFLPMGYYLGCKIAKTSYAWILIPIGMIVGFFIVAAEPAVRVLNKQVEDISNGTISQKSMRMSLAAGVACALGIAMFRILTGTSVFVFLLPGYALAIMLTFSTPKIFTAIAFDSGGVASGPMTATFLLPFAMGACKSLGGNILTDAFGIVAMVAMTPLITIQLLGIHSKRKSKALYENKPVPSEVEDEIIEL